MSNSHPPFGGYLDSSDHEGDSTNTFMQQAPYVPPRVTATSKSNLGSFQLPTLVAVSRASVPPTGKPNGLTARNVSVPPHRSVSVHPVSHRLASSGSGAAQSRQVTPSSVTGATSRDSTAKPSNALALRLPSTQPNILLERQVNEMSESFDEYKQAAVMSRAHDTYLFLVAYTLYKPLTSFLPLTRIRSSWTIPSYALFLDHLLLETRTIFSSCILGTTSPIVPSTASAPPENSNQDPFPSPTTELIKIVTRVVLEARLRVGKKKGGADENLAKEHTRQTFYRFVNITSSRTIKPYFKNEFGEPDTLPVQFNDPTTGEYAVFPHWKVQLSKQVAWIPAFIR
ncbi:hypothetical protein RhiJN_08088 [Ceratobasidium sp. AG-Ba]|nr:hypothetical protein RhiJN_08088 [Ceratobasidium sp. AG-Ba]